MCGLKLLRAGTLWEKQLTFRHNALSCVGIDCEGTDGGSDVSDHVSPFPHDQQQLDIDLRATFQTGNNECASVFAGASCHVT